MQFPTLRKVMEKIIINEYNKTNRSKQLDKRT